MITESHNLLEYNDFKTTIDKQPFFRKNIYFLGNTVLSSDMSIPENTTTDIDAKEKYIDYLLNEFRNLKLSKHFFAFDCGNGVAKTVLWNIVENLNINSKNLYDETDRTFPYDYPDFNEMETLEDIKYELSKEKYNLGFTYDGDADNIAVLSPKYSLKGDALALFFSKFIKNQQNR